MNWPNRTIHELHHYH